MAEVIRVAETPKKWEVQSIWDFYKCIFLMWLRLCKLPSAKILERSKKWHLHTEKWTEQKQKDFSKVVKFLVKNCTQIRRWCRVTRNVAIILHHPILHPQLSPDFDRMRSDGCALLKQRACSMFHIQATSSWLPKRLPEHTQDVFRGWPALTTIIIHPSHVHLFIHNMKVSP